MLYSWNRRSCFLEQSAHYCRLLLQSFSGSVSVQSILFWLSKKKKSWKVLCFFVELSSIKGTNTCIPAVCACNNCDFSIPRIENQYSETQPDWLHYIYNIHVAADSCKLKSVFFRLTIKKLNLNYGLKILINFNSWIWLQEDVVD